MDIQYNSWLEKFKKPFGAVKINQIVEFNIMVNSNELIKSVSLMIKKEADVIETSEITMTPFEKDFYKCHYQIEKGSGLYLYCFKVTAINQNGNEFILYYGKNQHSGEGYQYVDVASIEWYQLTCFEKDDSAPEWYQKGIFYQIFPDRFFNGNPNKQVNSPKKNSFLYGTETDLPFYVKDKEGNIERWDFFGGNLKGIEAKIPFLKELGITALYLNPIFEANSNHRYDTNNYFKIDPILGTNEDFLSLVDTLHQNEMYLILDGVFSHVGRNSLYFNYSGDYGVNKGAYQSPRSQYYDWFTFFNYPDKYKSWWGIEDLPTINKNIQSFQEFIYGKRNSVLDFWNQYHIDGWRLDVADEFPNFFLKGIREKLDTESDKVLIGEVWEDASNKVSYNERKEYCSHPVLHGVMNYPLREQILDLVNERKPMAEILLAMMNQKENYPDYFTFNCLNNIGTHDTRRILTECNGSFKKVILAFSLLFMMPGVPCIYYGDEVGLEGDKDPDNRRFYPWNNSNQALKKMCQNWIILRKSHVSLSEGKYHFFYHDKKQLMAVYRVVDTEESLCLFNFSDFEQKYSKNGWSCLDIEAAEVFAILDRFNVSETNLKGQRHLFLVKEVTKKE